LADTKPILKTSKTSYTFLDCNSSRPLRVHLLDSSVGRALQQYHRGHEFAGYCSRLKVFFFQALLSPLLSFMYKIFLPQFKYFFVSYLCIHVTATIRPLCRVFDETFLYGEDDRSYLIRLCGSPVLLQINNVCFRVHKESRESMERKANKDPRLHPERSK